MMNGGPISWKSRRQDHVSLSTSEAKFVAASQAGQKAIYLRETLTDLGFSQTKATLLYEDNLVCVAMSENPMRRKSTCLHLRVCKFVCGGVGGGGGGGCVYACARTRSFFV